jgi:hypothetical protein
VAAFHSSLEEATASCDAWRETLYFRFAMASQLVTTGMGCASAVSSGSITRNFCPSALTAQGQNAAAVLVSGKGNSAVAEPHCGLVPKGTAINLPSEM